MAYTKCIKSVTFQKDKNARIKKKKKPYIAILSAYFQLTEVIDITVNPIKNKCFNIRITMFRFVFIEHFFSYVSITIFGY